MRRRFAQLRSKLASYDQVENAYQAGGEWCGYGWSNQMALYQQKKHTTNYRQLRDMSTIVDDQELMEDI